MGQQYEVWVKVSSASDDAALKKAVSEIQNLGTAAKTTTGTVSGLSGQIKSLLGSLGVLGGLAQFVSMLKGGAKAAMDKERALIQLSNIVKQFGQDGDKAAAAAQALGDSLEKVGFDDTEIIEGVRSLVITTKDYEQSLTGASLAADISAKTGMQYGEALSVIQRLLGGILPRANVLNELGIKAENAQDAIDQLIERMTGAAAALNDNKSKWAALGEEVGNFSEAVGGPVSYALLRVINTIKELGGVLMRVVELNAVAYKGLGQAFVAFLKGDWAGSQKIFLDSLNGLKAKWKEIEFAANEAWLAAQGKKTNQQTAEDTTVPNRGRLSAGGGETDAAAAARARSEQAQREQIASETELLQNHLDDNFDRQLDYIRRVLKAKADAADAAEKIAEDGAKAEARAQGKAIADLLDRAEESGTLYKAEAETVKATEDQKIAAVQNFAAAASAIAGENKGIAIASTIINTYAGAMAAFKDTPGPVWVKIAAAVAAIAYGFAQVRAIQSQDTSGGGGGGGGGTGAGGAAYSAPGSASQGGVGSYLHSTFNPVTPSGASGGGGNSVAAYQTTQNVYNVHTMTNADADDAMRRFEKRRRPVGRSYNRSIINRGPTRAGG